jgi:hypothetical protein
MPKKKRRPTGGKDPRAMYATKSVIKAQPAVSEQPAVVGDGADATHRPAPAPAPNPEPEPGDQATKVKEADGQSIAANKASDDDGWEQQFDEQEEEQGKQPNIAVAPATAPTPPPCSSGGKQECGAEEETLDDWDAEPEPEPQPQPQPAQEQEKTAAVRRRVKGRGVPRYRMSEASYAARHLVLLDRYAAVESRCAW